MTAKHRHNGDGGARRRIIQEVSGASVRVRGLHRARLPCTPQGCCSSRSPLLSRTPLLFYAAPLTFHCSSLLPSQSHSLYPSLVHLPISWIPPPVLPLPLLRAIYSTPPHSTTPSNRLTSHSTYPSPLLPPLPLGPPPLSPVAPISPCSENEILTLGSSGDLRSAVCSNAMCSASASGASMMS